MIFDRRARAKSWTALDMAACNAEFWTGTRWDGSESMITRSRTKCLRFSKHSRVQLVSSSASKTVVITFQGVQACYALLAGLNGSFGLTSGVHTIFFPLAILGLLRLPAALWLSDEYGYACGDWPRGPASDLMLTDHDTPLAPVSRTTSLLGHEEAAPPLTASSSGRDTQQHVGSTHSLNPMQLSASESSSPHDLFHPIIGRRGVTTRIIFLVPLLGLWVLDLLYFRPSTDLIWTATNLSVNVYYFFLLTVTLVVMVAYVLKGESTTTIIPCINSMWYKVYTCMVFILALLMLVISALETQKTPCGQYTTYSTSLIAEKGWMQYICPDPPGDTPNSHMVSGTRRFTI